MKAIDIVENFLLELGVSLKDSYSFIPKRDYEYSTKGKTETIKLGEYEVKLSKTIRNTRELFYVMNVARTNFINIVTLSGNVSQACEKLMSHSVLYYAEFVKYIANKIDIKPELAEKIITLANGAMDNTAREIDNIIREFNVGMDKAHSEGARHNAELTAKAIADANKVHGYNITGYEREGLFGDTITVHATAITTGSSKRNEMISMANGAASKIQSIYEEIASDKAIECLRNIRAKVIDSFNSKLKELLSVKLDSYLEENLLDGNGTNIGDNPIVFGHYLDIIDRLKEEQFDDYKKAIQYYDINVVGDIKKRVEDNIYNYFVEEGKCDYNNIDYKLYIYLTGNKFESGCDVSNRIYEYLTKLDFGTIEENKELIATFDRRRKMVKNCTYILDSEKESILKSYDKFEVNYKKQTKNNIIGMILNIIFYGTGILGIITAFRYTTLFSLYNNYIYLYGFGGILIVIAIGYFMFGMKNNLIKKIIQIVLSVAFILVPILLGETIKEEAAKREGKYIIQLEVLGENQVLFLNEGERIPLDPVVKEGYVFNGWLNGSSYVFEELVVEDDAEFEADIYSTSENLTTVTFKLDNGQKNIVLKLPLYSEIPNIPIPTKEGYRFDGWYDEKLYKKQFSNLEIKMENPTYKAVWVK